MPLTGMKLKRLCLNDTKVHDLTPLKGMPLESLRVATTGVEDLSPLKGMPLKELDITSCPVADLRPLGDLPLTELHCFNIPAKDFSPLASLDGTRRPCPWVQYLADVITEEQLLKVTPLKKNMSSVYPLYIGMKHESEGRHRDALDAYGKAAVSQYSHNGKALKGRVNALKAKVDGR